MSSKISHDIKNALLRIESIFEILTSKEDSPFSKEQLSTDLQETLKEITSYADQLLKR